MSKPPVRHPAKYWGQDRERGTLKYRCPAKADGWNCPSLLPCNGDRSYGLSIRIPSRIDFRRFPPIPRATRKFEEMYQGRTAVERVLARLKLLWRLDDGNLVGAQRFHAQVHAVMLAHLSIARSLARTPRQEGRSLSRMKLSPIAKALGHLPTPSIQV